MSRAAKLIGSALAIIGVAVVLTFAVLIARDDGYRKAALAAVRNPGNVMYETEFGVARIRRGFQLIGVISGILLALNGASMVGLGVLASHVRELTSRQNLEGHGEPDNTSRGHGRGTS